MGRFLNLKVIFLGLLIGLAFPVVVMAQNSFNSGDNIVLGKDQVVNGDYFAAGKNVAILGTVNGDVYAAGGNLVIDGVINGDLIAAGGTVNIRGKVSSNIRVAGGSVNVSGEIGRNVSAVGGDVNIENSAKLHGSLVSGAGNLNIFAPLPKDLTAGAGEIALNGSVDGNVSVGTGSLSINPEAKIGGDLWYVSDQLASIPPTASISGKVVHTTPPGPSPEESRNHFGEFLSGISILLTLISFISALIIGFIFIKLVPVFSVETAEIIMDRPWKSLGIGFLTLIVTPLLILAIFVTIIGIPFGIMLLLGFLLALYLSKIFMAIVIGQTIAQVAHRNLDLVRAFVLGLVVYYLLNLIPFLGGLVVFFSLLLGLGALVMEKFNFYKLLREKELL